MEGVCSPEGFLPLVEQFSSFAGDAPHASLYVLHRLQRRLLPRTGVMLLQLTHVSYTVVIKT